MKTKTLMLSMTLLFFVLSAHARDKQFDQDLAMFASEKSVGYSVLISQQGKIIYQQAIGKANLELDVSLRPEHLFEIGSLSKQFTSVAILLLAQQDKLSLDDPIDLFIDGITSSKGQVTLKHLLAHTSGLVDPINSTEFLASRVQESISLDDLLTLFKNHHWQYPPGERVHYSNAGYSMLAKVIEVVSGQGYFDFLQQTMLSPLHMFDTHQASFAVLRNKASGYTFDHQVPRHHDFLNLNWAYGAGDLISTTSDLNRFTLGLMNGKILDLEHLALLFSPIALNNGSHTRGSFNADLSRIDGKTALRISGSTFGYSGHSIYLPDTKTYLVVLANSDGINGGAWIPPATVAAKLSASLLGLALPDYVAYDVPQSLIPELLGSYQQDENTMRTLSYDNGSFYYQRNQNRRYQVIPMSENRFFFPDTLSYFTIENPGKKDQRMSFQYFLGNEKHIAPKVSKP